ncbi:hypothetical protein OE506_25710, partial [Pseudomonas aeruginosa]|nr:hypothetical protein [Pseudomonas aeruginosa]
MTAVRRIRAAALPDLPDASWSNALLVGEELVMSGMTAHPATRQAAAGGGGGGGGGAGRGGGGG